MKLYNILLLINTLIYPKNKNKKQFLQSETFTNVFSQEQKVLFLKQHNLAIHQVMILFLIIINYKDYYDSTTTRIFR